MEFLFLVILILGSAYLITNYNPGAGCFWLFTGVLILLFPPLALPVAGLYLYITVTRKGGGDSAKAHEKRTAQKNYERAQARKGLPADPNKYKPEAPTIDNNPWVIHPNDDFPLEGTYGYNDWKDD